MKLTILKLAALVLTMAAGLVVCTNLGQAHPQQPQAVATPAAGLTAGQSQSFKNIKVLTDLPESQLNQVMDLFSASLGKRCDFCHVNNNGRYDYPADTKPEKNTAREMIRMVLDLHKRTFPGSTDISCYTCHRGHTSPVGVPQLPVPVLTPGLNPSAQVVTPSPVPGQSPAGNPTADQLIEKYVNAVGGQAALDKVKTWMMKGSQGGKNFEMARSAPDKFYMNAITPQGGVELGFNGTAGWAKDPRGVHDLPAAQLPRLKETSDYLWFDLAKFKEQYPHVAEQIGKDTIDGRDVYVITTSNPNGRRAQLVLDAETGLLRRVNRFTPTMLGVIPARVDFDNYREVDGVKVAFSIVVSVVDVWNPPSELKLTEVKLNPIIDDSKFNRPPAPNR